MTEKRGGWGDNPSELYAGMEFPTLPKAIEKQIPREQIVKDLVVLLKSMPLSDTQVEELYTVISNRARHKVCDKCKRLKITIGGKWEIHHSLDLSKPKSFVCQECA